jgi:UDP-N-acetylglucosamine 2-epimerase
VRRIAVVTSSRADYGNCVPVLQRLCADPASGPQVIVSGTHLSPEFGLTAREIEADRFSSSERVEMRVSSATPEGAAYRRSSI